MPEHKLCVPCLFGLEGPLGNELRHMGMDSVAPENGRVRFETDLAGLARANIRSRFAERILLLLRRFPARSKSFPPGCSGPPSRRWHVLCRRRR